MSVAQLALRPEGLLLIMPPDLSAHHPASLVCAQPACKAPITPRKAPAKFFLHCQRHRSNHKPLPASYPAPPSDAWGRYTCFACGALFEWYVSSAERGSTGRLFCDLKCRSEVGSKPTRYPMQQCEYLNCPRPGRWFQPHTPNRRFCSKSCTRKHNTENAKTLAKRITVNNAADLAEVRYCEGDCGTRLPPRNPINGVWRKRCEDCEDSAPRPGRPPLPDVKTTIVCSRSWCGKEVERYNSAVNQEGKHFCSREHSAAHPGDKWLLGSGYVMVYAPGHPTAQKNGWAMEHRKIVSDILGRPLLPSEEVHHRSGIKSANDPRDLILMSTSHPAGAGLRDKFEWCLRFIEENRAALEAVEAAGVQTTMDVDANVVALFDEDGNVRDRPEESSA